MDGIGVHSGVDRDFRPVVRLEYNGAWQFTPVDARQLAADMISEAAIAEVEGALLKQRLAKGFGAGAGKKAADYLATLRRCRPQPRPRWADAIYGFIRQQPLVNIFIDGTRYGKIWALTPDESRHIAALILHCAEGAETDAFLYKFLQADVGPGLGEVDDVIGRFRRFRDVNSLEDLL